MTIVQYLPQWLRNRWQKPTPQNAQTVSKKNRQVLPTLPRPKCPPIPWQDDDSPPGYPIYWRM